MKVRQQIFGTVIAVFLTFVLRAVYQTMFALQLALQNDFSDFGSCGGYAGLCDSACYLVNVSHLSQSACLGVVCIFASNHEAFTSALHFQGLASFSP